MARRKREFNTFNLSFLDIMSCGFGAVVLVFLIIDHSIEDTPRGAPRPSPDRTSRAPSPGSSARTAGPTW